MCFLWVTDQVKSGRVAIYGCLDFSVHGPNVWLGACESSLQAHTCRVVATYANDAAIADVKQQPVNTGKRTLI